MSNRVQKLLSGIKRVLNRQSAGPEGQPTTLSLEEVEYIEPQTIIQRACVAFLWANLQEGMTVEISPGKYLELSLEAIRAIREGDKFYVPDGSGYYRALPVSDTPGFYFLINGGGSH